MREGNITIYVKEKEAIERALKRFKRKCEKVKILKRIRAKIAYKKPSIKRREIRLKAIYRQKKQAEA